MKLTGVLRAAAVALAAGALVVTGVAPAKAVETYPPHVSVLYASPFLTSGYATVFVMGDHLAGLTVTASRAGKTTTAAVHVDESADMGSARVKVSSVLWTRAGLYPVTFTLNGTSVTGTVTTMQTYQVGTLTTIRNFSVTKKSYGLYIKGMTAKRTPVKVTVVFNSTKVYSKTVYSSSTGSFYYRLLKTTKGTYDVTAQVAPNTKYFSGQVGTTVTR